MDISFKEEILWVKTRGLDGQPRGITTLYFFAIANAKHKQKRILEVKTEVAITRKIKLQRPSTAFQEIEHLYGRLMHSPII